MSLRITTDKLAQGASVFMLTPNARSYDVWLARRFEPRQFAGLFECVGGSMEVGELPGQTAVRELLEEAGISRNSFDLESLGQTVAVRPDHTVYVMHGYVVVLGEDEVPTNTEPVRTAWRRADLTSCIDTLAPNALLMPSMPYFLDLIDKIYVRKWKKPAFGKDAQIGTCDNDTRWAIKTP